MRRAGEDGRTGARRAMRLLYIMDTVASILPDKDTTFAFLRSSQQRKHENFHTELSGIYLDRGEVRARARRIRVSEAAPFIELEGEVEDVALAELDATLIRKDPPFDSQYLHMTLLLEHARGKTLLVNDPRELREANEKLYALMFPDVVPRTLVSADRQQRLDFAASVGGKAVIKPLDGAGGFGVL